MNDREAAVHFYEMLTGVFDDDQSKIIRYVCFAVLFAGMVWAGLSYFRASILADTDTPLDEDMFQDMHVPENTAALQRVVDLAQTVDAMRSAGASIASTIEGIHNMPFNLDPEGGTLDPFGASGTGVGTIPSSGAQDNSPKAGPLTVKMIMTADDGNRVAVVDAGGLKAVVLRRGDEVPGGGFVRSIRPDGITVIRDKQEVKYDVPEIPKYNEIGKPRNKSTYAGGS